MATLILKELHHSHQPMERNADMEIAKNGFRASKEEKEIVSYVLNF